MSRSRIVVAVALGVAALTLWYGLGATIDRSPDAPLSPIELIGSLPPGTTISEPSIPTSTTSPLVVPPPTLGPTAVSAPQSVNIATVPTAPPPTPTTASPALAPVADDGDGVESDDDRVSAPRDEQDPAIADGDDDDAGDDADDEDGPDDDGADDDDDADDD